MPKKEFQAAELTEREALTVLECSSRKPTKIVNLSHDRISNCGQVSVYTFKAFFKDGSNGNFSASVSIEGDLELLEIIGTFKRNVSKVVL